MESLSPASPQNPYVFLVYTVSLSRHFYFFILFPAHTLHLLPTLTRRAALRSISSFYTLFSSFKRENTLNSQHWKKSFFVTDFSKRVFRILPYSRTMLRDRGSLRLWNCTQAVCGESLRTTVGTSSTY